MANIWTYADYRNLTDPAERLARLRLHMIEVSDRIGAGHKSRSGAATFPPEFKYYELLDKEATQLAAQVESSGIGSLSAPIAKSRGVFRRSR